MKHNLLKQLENIKHQIETTDITFEAKEVMEWGGADVIIKSVLDADTEEWLREQPLVINFQSTEPRRRVVVTKYSKELSWLFYQLKELFSEEIDYISKYDFYGLLAQSAIDYLTNNEETQDSKGLLLAVLNASEKF
jgi:hypothetical protein